MKKIFLLLSLLLVVSCVDNCFAQVEDPLNQTLKVNENWSSEPEKPITKKKKQQQTQTQQQTVITPKVEEVVEQSGVQIINSCPDEITVEFVSLEGNKSSQEVNITIKFTNHKINRNISIGNFIAFNQEGDKFSKWSIGNYNSLTDITQKTSWEIGQMLPSKNSKLTAISFELEGCSVEMRDVPIDWK